MVDRMGSIKAPLSDMVNKFTIHEADAAEMFDRIYDLVSRLELEDCGELAKSATHVLRTYQAMVRHTSISAAASSSHAGYDLAETKAVDTYFCAMVSPQP